MLGTSRRTLQAHSIHRASKSKPSPQQGLDSPKRQWSPCKNPPFNPGFFLNPQRAHLDPFHELSHSRGWIPAQACSCSQSQQHRNLLVSSPPFCSTCPHPVPAQSIPASSPSESTMRVEKGPQHLPASSWGQTCLDFCWFHFQLSLLSLLFFLLWMLCSISSALNTPFFYPLLENPRVQECSHSMGGHPKSNLG